MVGKLQLFIVALLFDDHPNNERNKMICQISQAPFDGSFIDYKLNFTRMFYR